MTCQINQKIYSYPKGGNLGNCPLFKEKGTLLCDGFIPDEANFGALLKVSELLFFDFNIVRVSCVCPFTHKEKHFTFSSELPAFQNVKDEEW